MKSKRAGKRAPSTGRRVKGDEKRKSKKRMHKGSKNTAASFLSKNQRLALTDRTLHELSIQVWKKGDNKFTEDNHKTGATPLLIANVIELTQKGAKAKETTDQYRLFRKDPEKLKNAWTKKNKGRKHYGHEPLKTAEVFLKRFKSETVHIYWSVAKFGDGKGMLKEDVAEHSTLFGYDIENISRETYSALKADPHTFILGESMSGPPNYYLVMHCRRGSVANHPACFDAGAAYLHDTYGIPLPGKSNTVGKSDDVRDITRIRYLAHDPNIYVNYAAESFHFIPSGAVMVEGFFKDWLCAPEGKSNKVKNKLFYAFGGLFAAGRLPQLETEEGARNHVRTQALLRNNDEGDAKAALHQFEEGRKKPMLDKGAAARQYVYSTMTGALSAVDGFMLRPLEEKTLLEDWITTVEVSKKGVPIMGFDMHCKIVKARAATVNPWEYFFTNNKWSGVDHFKILAKYVKTEREDWTLMLRKHMIRAINQTLGKGDGAIDFVNRYAFILQGVTTHTGKSTLLRFLTLEGKVSSFSAELDLHNSGHELKLSLSQTFNALLEELESLTERELAWIKSFISQGTLTNRDHFLKQNSERARMASLWGTVNHRDFLKSTDNRWIVISIVSIDWSYTNEVKPMELWAQAYAEWTQNHLAGELTNNERARNEETSKEFLRFSPTEQKLFQLYEPNLKRIGNPIAVIQVCEELDTMQTFNRGFQTQVGTGLRALFSEHEDPRKRVSGRKGVFYWITKKAV